MLDNKSIRNYMRGLQNRCNELNELHNNFDIDTTTENNYRLDLLEDIKDFNQSQTAWKAMLLTAKYGWRIKYV